MRNGADSGHQQNQCRHAADAFEKTIDGEIIQMNEEELKKNMESRPNRTGD